MRVCDLEQILHGFDGIEQVVGIDERTVVIDDEHYGRRITVKVTQSQVPDNPGSGHDMSIMQDLKTECEDGEIPKA